MRKLIEESITAKKPVDEYLEDLYEQKGSWSQVGLHFGILPPTIYRWVDWFVKDHQETKNTSDDKSA